jgi:hypothetical protein
MQAAEAGELGALETRNGAEDAGLLASASAWSGSPTMLNSVPSLLSWRSWTMA